MADKIFFKTGLASSLPTTKTAGQLLFAIDGTAGSIYLDKDSNTRIKFNADAIKLATPRSINGTSFDGSSDITTANWGTARDFTIGGTKKSVNGSQAYSWSLNEIGALPGKAANATTAATAGWYRIATTSLGINNNLGQFTILANPPGKHCLAIINAGVSYGYADEINLQQMSYIKYGSSPILTKARIVYHSTYSNNYAYLEVYVSDAIATSIYVQFNGFGWSLVAPSTAGSVPSGYSTKEITFVSNSIISNLSGKATSAGSADTAVKLTTPRAINGTNFDGSGAITTANWGTARNFTIKDADSTNSGTAVSVNGSNAVTLLLPSTIKANLTGKATSAGTADTAITATTATTTTGNAGTATKLQTARTINGTSFDGTGNITTSYWGTTRALKLAQDSSGSVNVNGGSDITLNVTNNKMKGYEFISGKVPYVWYTSQKSYENSTVPTVDWYVKVVIDADWVSDYTPLYIEADYSNVDGKLIFNLDGSNSYWTAYVTSYEGSNILAIRRARNNTTSKNEIFLKLKKPVEYHGVTQKGKITVYSPYTIDSITACTAADAGTLVNLNHGYNSNTPITTTAQIYGNAVSATRLQTARTINGTSFDGSGNITTSNWGTSRNFSIASSDGTNSGAAVSVNGSGNVTLKLPTTIKADLNGNATSVGDSTMKMYAQYNNEINFGGINDFATIYFSYRATDSKPIISTFVFGGPTGAATLKAASFTGNAATATKLATARSITLAGDVTGSTSFDGSSNVSITATVANDSHNHTYSTISLLGSYVSNTTYTSLPNGITYVEMPATATSTGDPTYGAMLTVRYCESRAFQLVGNSSNKLYFRGMHSGLSSAAGTGYGTWRAVALSDGGTYTMNITGNASGTASKLATARNITISGTASSSIGTFDGSANTTIYMPLTIKGFTSIESDKYVVNDKVTLQYNTTNECLEFVFA